MKQEALYACQFGIDTSYFS